MFSTTSERRRKLGTQNPSLTNHFRGPCRDAFAAARLTFASICLLFFKDRFRRVFAGLLDWASHLPRATKLTSFAFGCWTCKVKQTGCGNPFMGHLELSRFRGAFPEFRRKLRISAELNKGLDAVNDRSPNSGAMRLRAAVARARARRAAHQPLSPFWLSAFGVNSPSDPQHLPGGQPKRVRRIHASRLQGGYHLGTNLQGDLQFGTSLFGYMPKSAGIWHNPVWNLDK